MIDRLIRSPSLQYAFLFAAFVWQGISFGKVMLLHAFLPVLLAKMVLDLVNRRWRFDERFDFLWIVIGWTLLGAIWGGLGGGLFKYFFYLFTAASVFYGIKVMVTDEERLSAFLKVLAIFYSVHLVLSLVEAFGLARYPISIYSEYAVYFKKTTNGVFVDQSYFATSPTSFYWVTNFCAFVTSLGLSFVFFIRKTHWKVLFILLHLFLLIQSSSRGFILFAGLQLLVYLFYEFRLRSLKSVLGLLVVPALALTAISYWGLLHTGKTKEVLGLYNHVKEWLLTSGELIWEFGVRGNEIPLREGGNMNERASFMASGLRAFLESWGLGIGADRMATYPAYGIPGKTIQSPHNFFIELLAVGGIVMIAIWGHWPSKIFKGVSRSSLSFQHRCLIASLLLSCLGGVLIESSLIYFTPFYLVLALIAASLKLKAV